MNEIERQIKQSNIPYPHRRLLELEIKQDLEFADAEEKQELRFSDENLRDLHEIHSTKAYRFLQHFGGKRKQVEALIAFVPLITSLIFFMEDQSILDFIREGGAPGMSAIIIVGLFLLGKEALNIVRLLVVKDHSTENLHIDTPSVLLGCMGLMFVAIGWTALGLYKSAEAVSQMQNSYALMLAGLKESLTPLVLGSFLSAAVVLAHYGTRRVLRLWQAPLV